MVPCSGGGGLSRNCVYRSTEQVSGRRVPSSRELSHSPPLRLSSSSCRPCQAASHPRSFNLPIESPCSEPTSTLITVGKWSLCLLVTIIARPGVSSSAHHTAAEYRGCGHRDRPGEDRWSYEDSDGDRDRNSLQVLSP